MKKCALFLFVIALFACSEYDYYKEVQKELDKGVRYDSLFLGYYFGMPRQDFFDYSWELNKKELVTQGEYNQSIQYDIDVFDRELRMNFFPQYDNDVIAHMTVIFSHPAWSPWTKDLWSDKLILKIRDLLEKWHKVNFELIKDKNGTPGFVTVKGNKRIAIAIKDDEQVIVLYTDLTALENPLDSLILNKKYE